MVTPYEINEALFACLLAATQGNNPTIGIGGQVFNKDRDGSFGEDLVVITTNVVGDEFPQTALANINAYVFDVMEDGNGYVRDGLRLSQLTKAISSFLDSLLFDNMELEIENIAEIEERDLHQHYVNFRVRLFVYDNFSKNV